MLQNLYVYISLYQYLFGDLAVRDIFIIGGSNYDSLLHARRVSGPNSLLDHEVIAPCGYSVPCQF